MAKTPAAPAQTDQTEGTDSVAAAAQQQSAQLVRMVRSTDDYPPPHTADVHPDEVANFSGGGWLPA